MRADGFNGPIKIGKCHTHNSDYGAKNTPLTNDNFHVVVHKFLEFSGSAPLALFLWR